MSNKFKKISSYDTINDCESFNTLLGVINNKTYLSPLKKISVDTKWDQCISNDIYSGENLIEYNISNYKGPGFLNVAYEVVDFNHNTIIGQQDILLTGSSDKAYREPFLINKTDTDMTFLRLSTSNGNYLSISANTISKRPIALFAETKATLKSLVLDDKTIYYTNDYYNIGFENALYDIVIDDNIVYTGTLLQLDYALMIEYEDDDIHVVAGEGCFINEEDGTLETNEPYTSVDCLAIEIKNSNFDFDKIKIIQHFEEPGTIICSVDFSDFILSTDGIYYYANFEKSTIMEGDQSYSVFIDDNNTGEDSAYYNSYANYTSLSTTFNNDSAYIFYQDNSIIDGDGNVSTNENSCYIKVALLDDIQGELPSFNNVKIIKTDYNPVSNYLVNFSDMTPVNIEGKSIYLKKDIGTIADFRYDMTYDIFVNEEKIGSSEFITEAYYQYIEYENNDLIIWAADGLCDYNEEEAFISYSDTLRTILVVEKKSNDLSIETIELRLPEDFLGYYEYDRDLSHVALRSVHYCPIDCLKDKAPIIDIFEGDVK